MLRVTISISKGKIRSSTILRKLGTYSRKNKLYLAFRELGRVVRTVFLLNYIASIELRQIIDTAPARALARARKSRIGGVDLFNGLPCRGVIRSETFRVRT